MQLVKKKKYVRCNHCSHEFWTGATTLVTTCNGCMGKIRIDKCEISPPKGQQVSLNNTVV